MGGIAKLGSAQETVINSELSRFFILETGSLEGFISRMTFIGDAYRLGVEVDEF